MDDVVNSDGGKFRLGEPEHLLPPLVERDDAQVQLVLRLEHHLGGRVRIGRERIAQGGKKSPGGRKRRSLPPSGASPAGWEGQRGCRCKRGPEEAPLFFGSDHAAA